MDTKKSKAILKGIAQPKRKPVVPKTKARLVEIAKTDPNLSAIKSPFWKRVFTIGRLPIDEIPGGYIDLTMELQDTLRDATKRFRRNKNKNVEVVKYNLRISKIRRQLGVLNTLRNKLGMLDHMAFLKSQNKSYVQQIPFNVVQEFLAKRAASPGVNTMQNSVVGRNTDRAKKRKRAILVEPHSEQTVATQLDELSGMLGRLDLDQESDSSEYETGDEESGATNHPYKSELVGASSRINHSCVAWYPGAKGIVLADPEIVLQDNKYYKNGLHVPSVLVTQQDGIFWHRAKKSWLDRVAAHGRNFVENSVGYIMPDKSVHVETMTDYDNFIKHFNAPPMTYHDVKNEFSNSGLTNNMVWKAKTVKDILGRISKKNASLAAKLETKLTDKIVSDANSTGELAKFVSLVEVPNISSLFVGISEAFANKIVREATSIQRLITFMASLDSFIPGNKMHRSRFYSEHYKAKIVNVPIETIFPEIFSNPDITKSQRQMVRDKIAEVAKRIEVFINTGKKPQQYAKPVVNLPIRDISVNPNAFWYIDIHGVLSVGVLGDDTLAIHPNSMPYVNCLIKVSLNMTDVETQQFDIAPKEPLLANNLLCALEESLLKYNQPSDGMQTAASAVAAKLARVKGNIKDHYEKNPDILET